MAPLRGRGASSNPPNRFTKRSIVPDAEAPDPEEPLPRTQFLKDTARTIIARNDSPDVGFETSINPYRGCEHGCVYCLSGETPILLADGTHRPLAEIRPGDWIYGTSRSGWYRRYVKTQVLDHWVVRKKAYRVVLEDSTQIVASGDHRFLTERGWKYVTGREQGQGRRPHLTLRNKLMGIGRLTPLTPLTMEYKRGYLCGLVRGDGHLGAYAYERAGRSNGDQFRFRLAMADDEPLGRASEFLETFGVGTRPFLFAEALGSRRSLRAIRASSEAALTRIGQIVSWRSEPPAEWSRGFLGGIFDAEGSYSGGCLRIANTDSEIVFQVEDALTRLGFRFVTEDRGLSNRLRYVRLVGGLPEALRFFHVTQPSIIRKRNLEHSAVKSSAKLEVIAIEPLERSQELFDITTGTGDFIANGVVSHNCYARPFHEYLGFSPGIDFETKILVKEDAPALLREELSSPKWKPQTIALSGVTDCYQPAERKFRLTRGCLEVLAEFRNPAVVITKNHLVTRDVDLLSELARHRAAAVAVSITTLDASLARTMEPRTSTPSRRLAAMQTLAAAGVPVGVNVAPIIPGLTDAEVPAILKAAAEAGASFAGHTVVRLPHAVKEIFEKWLEEQFPDRKKKVLHRIQDVRGGALNDPRFGSRMSGEGVYAEQIQALFELSRKKAGLTQDSPELSAAAFRVPPGPQLTLF
jgi:DNA repair photolyase